MIELLQDNITEIFCNSSFYAFFGGLYGIKEENEYTFSFSTKVVASIPFSTKYVEDSSLAPGEERIKQKGANGVKTETYITKSLNGKVISTKLLSKDTYDAMTKIILRGKQPNTTTIQPTTPTTTPTTPIPEQTTQTTPTETISPSTNEGTPTTPTTEAKPQESTQTTQAVDNSTEN